MDSRKVIVITCNNCGCAMGVSSPRPPSPNPQTFQDIVPVTDFRVVGQEVLGKPQTTIEISDDEDSTWSLNWSDYTILNNLSLNK